MLLTVVCVYKYSVLTHLVHLAAYMHVTHHMIYHVYRRSLGVLIRGYTEENCWR